MDARAPSVTGRLGPYRLLHVIGGGGMGVVHLALDPAERAVAVKVLRPHLAADPGARARLAREVEVLRRVRSPRVAEVIDADPDAEQPYLVTQFVPAPPLDAHIASFGPMTGGDLARLALGLGDALAAIHAVGVVHRDLKPANVLVRDGEAVVIDFGIAQIADDVRLTSTGLVMGTPGYLSPEVLDGGSVTASADWWGWAATVAFAATGRPPFGGGPTEAVLSRVRRGIADLGGAPAALAAVLDAALAPDPTSRPRPRHLREAVQALTSRHETPSAVRAGPAGRAGHAGADVTTEPERTNVLPFRHPDPDRGATRVVSGARPREQDPDAEFPTARYAQAATVSMPPATGSSAAPTTVTPTRPMHDVVHSATAPTRVVHPAHGSHHPVETPPQLVPPPAQPAGESGASATPVRRSASPGVCVALLVALVASAAVAPGLVVVVVIAGVLLSRTIDRAQTRVARRRSDRGPRRSDAAVITFGLPGQFVGSALRSVPPLLLAAGMAVSATFLVAWASAPAAAFAPNRPLPLAAGALSGLLTIWWGPSSAAVRRGGRACVRTLAGGRRSALVVLVALTLVTLAALLVAQGDPAPDWTPVNLLRR